MARQRPSRYPRVIYGPHGVSMTIDRPDQWIKGWTSSVDGDGEPRPDVENDAIPYTRSALKKMLREKGIEFKESAADKELWVRLKSHG